MVEVRAVFLKGFDRRRVTPFSSSMQRCPAPIVAGIHVFTKGKRGLHGARGRKRKRRMMRMIRRREEEKKREG
jgi:hypothetical protein